MTRLALTIALLLLLAVPAAGQTCGDVLDVPGIATADIDSVQGDRVLECVHVPTDRRWTLQRVGGRWLVACPVPRLGSLSYRMEPVPGCVQGVTPDSLGGLQSLFGKPPPARRVALDDELVFDVAAQGVDLATLVLLQGEMRPQGRHGCGSHEAGYDPRGHGGLIAYEAPAKNPDTEQDDEQDEKPHGRRGE